MSRSIRFFVAAFLVFVGASANASVQSCNTRCQTAQTDCNLRCDGTLWKWSTFRSGASYLFGQRGLIRQTFKPWRDYLRRDFHPRQQDSSASARWLRDNSATFRPVGQPA